MKMRHLSLRRRLLAVVVIALAIVGLTYACAVDREPSSFATRPNIVLISVDSLRADHLGCYGYDRPTSPTLDHLAAGGALFEVATSSSSWTLPAHASLFTGLPDSVHGVDRGTRKLEPARRTLAEVLRAAGYRTAGVWSGPLLDPRFGFGQGFDRYLSHAAEEGDWERAVERSHRVVTGPSVLNKVDGLLPFLSEAPKPPFFLFVHLWDVHYDYIPPPPFDTKFTAADYDGPVTGRNLVDYLHLSLEDLSRADLDHLTALYDGEIAWTDQQIASILARLEDAGLAGDTLVVVMSDHGEELFEHGSFGHKRTLFDESIRIPLVVWAPGRVPAGQRIRRPVRIVDVAPTLIELARGEPMPDVMGRSLLPLLVKTEDEGALRSPPAISELVEDPQTGQSLLAVRSARWKILLRLGSGTPLGLWDLAEDPEEQVNLLGTAPRWMATAAAAVDDALAELERLRERHPLPGPRNEPEVLPDDVREELESLGYLDTSTDDGGQLRAEPNPIEVCDGTGLGATTLAWNLPEASGTFQVRVDSRDGKLFASGGARGRAETGKWVRDGMSFVLVDSAGGEVLGRAVVRHTFAGCQAE